MASYFKKLKSKEFFKYLNILNRRIKQKCKASKAINFIQVIQTLIYYFATHDFDIYFLSSRLIVLIVSSFTRF